MRGRAEGPTRHRPRAQGYRIHLPTRAGRPPGRPNRLQQPSIAPSMEGQKKHMFFYGFCLLKKNKTIYMKTVICRSNHTGTLEIDLDLRTFARPWGARTLSLDVFWVDGCDTELRQLA